MIWANLIHLSYNMWIDREEVPELRDEPYLAIITAKPYLRFDVRLWNDVLRSMPACGVNTVVIDLGDAVKYESHPELAVEGAWSVERLREEITRMRELGLEPIPKLNFSATHDAWLGPYSRCVSTQPYYDVCKDLINEIIDIFDNPPLFHLGMDEETYEHQRYHQYVVIRQHDLWWNDFYFYVDQVEKRGVRAWVWSDYLWHHPETFFKMMPKSVLQSNWYYEEGFENLSSPGDTYVKAYLDMEAHGYDQVPAGSNHSSPLNFGNTVDYCRQHIAPQRLQGFFQTVWRPMTETFRQRQMEAVTQIGSARDLYERGS